ncbi:hypothetical protein GCM10027425_29000 [Alteromonas gracilis]
MKGRTALAVAAWLVVVVVGSAVAWTVIRTAGTDLSATPGIPASAPSTRPSPVATPSSGSPSPTASATASSPTGSSSPAAPRVQRQTWEGQAGAVTVACQGGTASLAGATAYAGWRVEVESRGPREVSVKFESGEREVEVEARCAGGRADFAVKRED